MKTKKLIAVMLVLAMVVASLSGCGTKNKDTQGSQDRSAYPGTSEPNAITVNIASEPPQMFSVTTTDTTSFSVIRHVIENLVELDANDKVIPGVATDWKVSSDGLNYTFNLRKDMKWSNGEPVTAKDFVFAWTCLLTPSFASDYAYFGYIFKNGQEFNEGKVTADQLGFKATDDYTLEVTLAYPAPYFLSTLAFGVFAPLNEKTYNQYGDKYGTDADKMIYNGPFKMTSWEHENKIVLEKNPDYYDASKINLDKITMVMINDTNAAMNAFKAGEVDIIGLNGDQANMMKQEGYPINNYDDGSVWYLQFNVTDKLLANANLRNAIAYGIDKNAFIASIVKNDSKPAVSYTAPAVNGLKDKFATEVGTLVPEFDKAKAQDYLNKAKQELGVDSISLTMLSDDSDTAANQAAFVQEQLKTNLGIDLKIESMPFKSRLARMSSHDFQMVFAGWGPDYNDPMTFLDMYESNGGNNQGMYSNPEYDALLDKARKELDPKTRFGYLMDLEKLLMKDMPIAPVYWRSRDYLMSGKIESGVIRSAFQDMNYRFVKLAK